MTSALTDVTSDVESVFDALECVSEVQNPSHEGRCAGFIRWHSCNEGYLCSVHYDRFIQSTLSKLHKSLEEFGRFRCGECKEVFFKVDDFVKVYPL